MKDFTLLAEDAGARAPIVLPIPSNDDPTEFPGTVSAETGTFLLLMRAAAFSEEDMPDVDISTEMYERAETELLGDGAQRLLDLGISPHLRQWVVSVLTVWHLLGREAGEAAWDLGPNGMQGKASPRATSPKTGGRTSKGATSASTRSPARTPRPRSAGASSARPATPRARRTG